MALFWSLTQGTTILIDLCLSAESLYERVSTEPKIHCYWPLERYSEGLSTAEQLIEQDPDDYRGWFEKGWGLYAVKQYNDAKEYFTKALKLDPGSEDALSYLNEIEEQIESHKQEV